MNNREMFAERLKQLRNELGKTQKQFADFVESTPATISAYENATKNPSLDIIMNIAEKCEISIDWLCGITDKKQYSEKIQTYSDWIKIISKLLEAPGINSELKLIDDPNYEGPAEYCSAFGAIYFDNYECTKIISEWMKYRNVGNDFSLNQNINKMWIEQACQKYASTNLDLPFPYDSEE